MTLHRLAFLSVAMLVPACLVEGEPERSSFEETIDVEPRCLGCDWGPPVTNTHGVNGLSVAALDTTGAMHDGWRLLSINLYVGVDRAPRPVFNVSVDEGVLYGVDAGQVWYSGEDFVGSEWTVQLEETDDIVVMRIDDFEADQVASRYTFVGGHSPVGDEGFNCAQDPTTGEYSAVLFRDLDVDPVSGTHVERASTIYFGCTSGAIGKVASWGYSPWNTSDAMHQTATRAARADFCGDGVSYTQQGTPLQLTDVLHVREFVESEKATEAMWGPGGAQCLLTPRLGQDPMTIFCDGGRLPECGSEETLQSWQDALLWTKIAE